MSPRGQKSATFIGTWDFPSGNSADVYVWRDGVAFHTLHLWDSGPPLTPADEGYYRDVVRPQVIVRVQEFLKLPGRVAVIELA